jgi:hypothetical protein
MRLAETTSWSISVDQWDQQLEWALWFRAAERIEVPAGAVVTGPPEVDPLPEPSLASGEPLVEGWLFWWRAVLADRLRLSAPLFEDLTDYPELRQVVTARWRAANAWHTARKRAGIEAFQAARGRAAGREGTVVRAVEAEIGHKAAPFTVRIIVLPVLDEQIRSAGDVTFLVPERMYVSDGYEAWLRRLVRALA